MSSGLLLSSGYIQDILAVVWLIICALTLMGATSGTRIDSETNNSHIERRIAGLAGCWLALFKTDRADLRQPTVSFSLFLSSPVLSSAFTTLSLSEIIFLFSLSLSLLLLCLPLSLSLAFSSCLIPSNKHRRTAQEQFILFISSSSSSFLWRDKDGDFFIREDLRSRILRPRAQKRISMPCYLRNYPFRRSSDTDFKLWKHANTKEASHIDWASVAPRRQSPSASCCCCSFVFRGSLTIWLRSSPSCSRCHFNWWKNNTFFSLSNCPNGKRSRMFWLILAFQLADWRPMGEINCRTVVSVCRLPSLFPNQMDSPNGERSIATVILN